MLGRKHYTITRPTGSYDANGRWVIDSNASISISASVQPLTDNEMKSLEEGRKNESVYKMYTDFEVKTADVSEGTCADLITIYSQIYEVIKVNKFQAGILSHYKAIIAKVEQ